MGFFSGLLSFMAQLGLSLLGLVILARFGFVLYLWLVYDRPIEEITDNVDAAKKKLYQDVAGRGVTIAGLAPHLAAIERPAQEKLEILKLKRQHFLDRINLFVSLAALGKS